MKKIEQGTNTENILFSQMTREELMEELRCIAMAKYSDFVDVVNGECVVKNLDSISDDNKKAICYVKNGTGAKGCEIKLYDKMKALELMGKCLGIFDGDVGEEALLDDLDKQIFNNIE